MAEARDLTNRYSRFGWNFFLPRSIQGDVLYIGDSRTSARQFYGRVSHSVDIYAFSPGESSLKSLQAYIDANRKEYDAVIVDSAAICSLARGNASSVIRQVVVLVLQASDRILKADGIVVYQEAGPVSPARFLALVTHPLLQLMLWWSLFFNARKAGMRTRQKIPCLCAEKGIVEVFYGNGYRSIKNSFRAREKFKQLLFSRLLLWWTAPLKIVVLSGRPLKSSLFNRLVAKLAERGEQALSLLKVQCLGGKTIVNMANREASGNGCVLVLPEDEQAVAGRSREIASVDRLRDRDIVDARVLPESLGKFTVSGFGFFVLREIEGISVDVGFADLPRATNSAFAFLTGLHHASADPQVLRGEVWERHITAPGRDLCGQFPELAPDIKDLEKQLAELLQNTRCNLIWQHGDFKLENILFNPATWEINGVIDWEYSRESGPCLLDLLYLLVYNRHIAMGQGVFEAYEDMVLNENYTDEETAYLDQYRDRFEITPSQFRGLCGLFLLDHISTRLTLGQQNVPLVKSYIEATAEWLKYSG